MSDPPVNLDPVAHWSTDPVKAAQVRATISAKNRAAWAAGKFDGRANGSLLPETQDKIAAAIRARWADGTYAGRVNGMAGRYGADHPNWTWGAPHYREILAQHQPPACSACGVAEPKVDAHHLDEDHGNYLLTNLAWFCVPCHMWRFHYETRGVHVKRPYVTIAKQATLEYAHILPWHPGKCARLHGHSGVLTAQVRLRLDPNDVVTDFGDLGGALKAAIERATDHQLLNDLIPNPTSEAMLVWAWRQLEDAGVKGLSALSFSETATSSATLTAADMTEAFGWARDDDDRWILVPKSEPA
jgi:6-pyruvoyltetrahydropterin/6-carboxytetrahydropterin synthase